MFFPNPPEKLGVGVVRVARYRLGSAGYPAPSCCGAGPLPRPNMPYIKRVTCAPFATLSDLIRYAMNLTEAVLRGLTVA